MTIQQTKSTLAKLMASENINIVHVNDASTAWFDLESRTLCCPVWKDMSGDLYDLLMGHEVGHALETPAEGWHDSVCDRSPGFKTILNIVEDSRIERLIKNRYPGLRRSFVRGYRSLAERDLFGIKEVADLGSLNLADRINLQEKIGAFTFVPFTEQETEILSQVQNAETWEDVVSAAEIISKYILENEKEKPTNKRELDEMISEDQLQGSSEEASEGDPQQNSEGDSEGDSSDESKENQDSEESDDQKESDENHLGENSSFDPSSVTDSVFREREKELVDGGTAMYSELEFPKPKTESIVRFVDQLRTFVQEVSTCIENYVSYRSNFDNSHLNVTYDFIAKSLFAAFNSENRNYINMLVKEFEMRKNASQYARSSSAKTGVLDTKNLSNYKFTNDLFKKVSNSPKGKSHGLTMFVDFSGSMEGRNLSNALNQVLCLATFCKKVNVPFVVYSFTNVHKYSESEEENRLNSFEYKKGKTLTPYVGVDIINLISSDLSPKDYSAVFNALLVYAQHHSGHGRTYQTQNIVGYPNNLSIDQSVFQLGGTPYIEMLYFARVLAPQFKASAGIDVNNVIILSDGEGTTEVPELCFYVRSERVVVVLIDPETKTRKEVKIEYGANHQHIISDRILGEMDANVIGFYISSSSQTLARQAVKFDKDQNYLAVRSSLKKDGYVAVKCLGFDEYYLLLLQIPKEWRKNTSNNVKNEKTRLFNEFKGDQETKFNSKIIASKFCKRIAA